MFKVLAVGLKFVLRLILITIGIVLGASLLLAALLYGSLKLFDRVEFADFGEWRWHQRLELEVETPAGLVRGASVQRNETGATPSWLFGGGMGSRVKGEALVLEVAPGRYLFALLSETKYDPFVLFFPKQAPREVATRLAKLRAKREIPPDQLPLLVTFDNVADPRTVQRVDPANLAASFGPGISLKSATLEILSTYVPVTKGEVEKRLGPIWGSQLNAEWTTLSSKQHDLLSSLNWKRGN
jgi:hypothetical protein